MFQETGWIFRFQSISHYPPPPSHVHTIHHTRVFSPLHIIMQAWAGPMVTIPKECIPEDVPLDSMFGVATRSGVGADRSCLDLSLEESAVLCSLTTRDLSRTVEAVGIPKDVVFARSLLHAYFLADDRNVFLKLFHGHAVMPALLGLLAEHASTLDPADRHPLSDDTLWEHRDLVMAMHPDRLRGWCAQLARLDVCRGDGKLALTLMDVCGEDVLKETPGRTSRGDPLLIWACWKGREEVALKLIETFGDAVMPGYVNSSRATALIHTCCKGLRSVAHKLIYTFGSAVNPGQVDTNNKTALIYACDWKLICVAHVLIYTFGDAAKPLQVDKTGKSAMDYAKQRGLDCVVAALSKYTRT